MSGPAPAAYCVRTFRSTVPPVMLVPDAGTGLAWVAVKVCPPTVGVEIRKAPAFAVSVAVVDPEPVPLAGRNESHASGGAVVQGQAASDAVTVIKDVPPDAGMAALVGAIPKVQPDA